MQHSVAVAWNSNDSHPIVSMGRITAKCGEDRDSSSVWLSGFLRLRREFCGIKDHMMSAGRMDAHGKPPALLSRREQNW